MLWDCIYIKDIKVKLINIYKNKLFKRPCPGHALGYYATFVNTETEEEYNIKISRAEYKRFSNDLSNEDSNRTNHIVQSMIFKQGLKYKHKIGIAKPHIYSEYNKLDEGEKAFYEYIYDSIKSKSDEYELHKLRRRYKNILIVGSLALMYIVTICTNM